MRRYWLFKSEPDCFSIDHLKSSPAQTAPWDGVRNFQARNLLRDDVQLNDRVLFYNSSTKPLGIAGTCVVVRAAYPDHTAWDPKSDHFDPRASKVNPIWYMVDVKFESKLNEILPLQVLKETPGLENMVLCSRGSRLSIQPVTPDEWRIVEVVMKGYRSV